MTTRRMNQSTRVTLFLLVVLALSLVMLCVPPRPKGRRAVATSQPLLMYCAAGVKPPVERAARHYELADEQQIQLQYGGSGTLLSNLQIGIGDLYLAADASYLAIAEAKGWVAEAVPVAHLQAGLAVQAGNPLRCLSIDDLTRADVKLGLANPDAASVGKLTKQVLQAQRRWAPIADAAMVFKPTVTDLANDLKLGLIDAAIIWDATAQQYPEIDFVALPAFEPHKQTVSVGILHSTANADAARRFVRYLTDPEQGGKHFADFGYTLLHDEN